MAKTKEIFEFDFASGKNIFKIINFINCHKFYDRQHFFGKLR